MHGYGSTDTRILLQHTGVYNTLHSMVNTVGQNIYSSHLLPPLLQYQRFSLGRRILGIPPAPSTVRMQGQRFLAMVFMVVPAYSLLPRLGQSLRLECCHTILA